MRSALQRPGFCRHPGALRPQLALGMLTSALAHRDVLVPAATLCSLPAALAEAAMTTDEDDVQMLHPSAAGVCYRPGQQAPQSAPGFAIERKLPATARTEGPLRYWNVPSHALTCTSGGSGWTSRLHLSASGGQQLYTWQTQQSYLSGPTEVWEIRPPP